MVSKIVIISPYSKQMRNGKENPKNYPYWSEVVEGLNQRGIKVIQVGVTGEDKIPGVLGFVKDPTFRELTALVQEVGTFISVDNFFQHLCHYVGVYGIVLWGKSDPNLFGYPENVNLLKSRNNLRKNQFDIWEAETFTAEVFVLPGVVTKSLEKILNN